MPPHRTGDQTHTETQTQHRQAPSPAGAFEGLLDWAETHLGTPLSVGDLAVHLGVSPRTLSRRFTEQLGTGPGAYRQAFRATCG